MKREEMRLLLNLLEELAYQRAKTEGEADWLVRILWNTIEDIYNEYGEELTNLEESKELNEDTVEDFARALGWAEDVIMQELLWIEENLPYAVVNKDYNEADAYKVVEDLRESVDLSIDEIEYRLNEVTHPDFGGPELYDPATDTYTDADGNEMVFNEDTGEWGYLL